jgi:prepilin-type N-terminal cleavage/methylation domain-containing protein
MTSSNRNQGFTLIELLVVMAIIATLAGLAVVGIPTYLREADKTACAGQLQKFYGYLMTYQNTYKSFPRASGPAFVMSVWDAEIVDHTVADAKIFFSPGTGNKPEEDLSNVNVDEIDYTGPDQENRRTRIRPQMRNANDFPIMCNRIPSVVEGEADLSDFPHAAKGINVLFAGGEVRWFDAKADFGEEYPIIGPESPIEKLRHLVPDE